VRVEVEQIIVILRLLKDGELRSGRVVVSGKDTLSASQSRQGEKKFKREQRKKNQKIDNTKKVQNLLRFLDEWDVIEVVG
jgi:hypothetical protein